MEIIEIVKEVNQKQIIIDQYQPQFHGCCVIAKSNDDIFILKEENNRYIWKTVELVFCTTNSTSPYKEHFCSIKDAINNIIEKGFKVYSIASYNIESFIHINI